MVVQRKTLMESLKLAMPGIETGNTTLPGADAFIFHNGKIYSYNDLVSVAVPLEQAGLIEESIEGAVHADEFYKVVSKFSSEEIEFSTGDKAWVLKNGKSKAELTLMDFDYSSRLEGVEPAESWDELPADFADGLGVCLMGNNKTPMAGIYVSGDFMLSTDGWQVNRYQFPQGTNLPVFWLSDRVVSELLKLGKLDAVQLNGNWVHFRLANEAVLSVKGLATGKFPLEDVEKVMEIADGKEGFLHGKFPLEMFSAIDRAVPFSIDTAEKPAVKLTLSQDGINVESARSTGSYTENVPWNEAMPEFEEVSVYVDPLMMAFIAKRSTEFYLVEQTLKSGKKTKRLLFVTSSSTHLVSTISVA